MTNRWLLGAVVTLVACSESNDSATSTIDAGTDAGTDSAAILSDGGVDATEDAGAAAECSGGLYDPATDLCWQNPSEAIERTFQEAIDYCTSLTQGGVDGWRMPSIDELRSLVVGCPATQPGGGCLVTEGSGSEDFVDVCGGCSSAAGQCHWPSAITASCDWFHWSSSVHAEYPGEGAWMLYFRTGAVNWEAQVTGFYAICVRTGQ